MTKSSIIMFYGGSTDLCFWSVKAKCALNKLVLASTTEGVSICSKLLRSTALHFTFWTNLILCFGEI